MKIGIACFSGYGGSGVVASELGVHLARRGHEVHFFSRIPPVRYLDLAGVRFHPVDIPPYRTPSEHPPASLPLALDLARVADAEGIEILHAHYAIPHAASALMARRMARRAQPAVVVTLHGTDVTRLGRDPRYRSVVARSVARADAVTVVSRYLRGEARTSWPHLRVPMRVIPNFVDPGVFYPAEGGGPAGDPVVVHVSNFRRLKRVTDAVRAFALARREVPSRLVLVGDGEVMPEVRSEVERLGVSPWVEFLGSVRDVAPILRSARAFLFPSEEESFGVAALEAMASGVPIVATRTGGIPEVVREEETGFLVDVGDTAAMARALARTLADPGLARRLGEAGRRRALARFAPEAIVDAYEDLYRRLRIVAEPDSVELPA